jgi:hypothetical protein
MKANRILLTGDHRLMEGLCYTAIKPGMLIKLNSSGQLIPHNSASGAAERAFALEDALQGNTVDTAYVVTSGTAGLADYVPADMVQYALVAPGAEVNALLGGGYAYTVGEKLVSGGDGTLVPATTTNSATAPGEEHIIAIVLPLPGTASTGLDISDSSGDDQLHPVRIL